MTPDETSAAPSGTGCRECDDVGGWWVHLRRCAACGHVGCCDSSPAQHATAHYESTGHPLVQSFEPGEDWFWDYDAAELVDPADVAAAPLTPPTSRPLDQASPGPRGRVPLDWRTRIHT